MVNGKNQSNLLPH